MNKTQILLCEIRELRYACLGSENYFFVKLFVIEYDSCFILN